MVSFAERMARWPLAQIIVAQDCAGHFLFCLFQPLAPDGRARSNSGCDDPWRGAIDPLVVDSTRTAARETNETRMPSR